jgi:uncharacterized protein
MTTKTTNNNTTLTAVLHLSVFTKYFIPLGNFIFPLLLWLSKRQDPFVDQHGRSALNFQISTFLYAVFLITVGVTAFIFYGVKLSMGEGLDFDQEVFHWSNFSETIPFIAIAATIITLLLGLFVLELFAVISASIKASEGKTYKYPLTINFLGSASPDDHHQFNQSKNEQFNDTQKQTL